MKKNAWLVDEPVRYRGKEEAVRFKRLLNYAIAEKIIGAVRAFALPDLFAGKMHAVLCRRWQSRVKGRDWYDFVWFAGRHPEIRLSHLEQRMRQTGHWTGDEGLGPTDFYRLIDEAIGRLDVDQAKREVLPFVKRPEELDIWSKDFFQDVACRVVPIGM